MKTNEQHLVETVRVLKDLITELHATMASMQRVAITEATGSSRWANELERQAALELYGERGAIEVDGTALVWRTHGASFVQAWLRVDTTTLDNLKAAVARAAADAETSDTKENAT